VGVSESKPELEPEKMRNAVIMVDGIVLRDVDVAIMIVSG
jgi:hypothetical protein